MTPKTIKRLSIVFSLVILVLLIYSAINYRLLHNKIDSSLDEQVKNYGYLGVFIISYIVEILPQPFVSALVPYANGLIFGLGFIPLLIITLIAVLLSSITGYYLGFFYGKKITMNIIGKEHYKKYSRFFKKYGNFAMTIAALTPFPYLPLVPGIFKMNLKNFILHALIPRLIYFVIFCYILFLII